MRIGLLYLISGFGGSLLSALFIQSNISVGASGALFGLLGGMLSELITNWSIYANKVSFSLMLVKGHYEVVCFAGTLNCKNLHISGSSIVDSGCDYRGQPCGRNPPTCR